MTTKTTSELEVLGRVSFETPLVASNYMDDDITWGVLDQANNIRARCSKEDAHLFAWAVNHISGLVDENRQLREEIQRLRRSIG